MPTKITLGIITTLTEYKFAKRNSQQKSMRNVSSKEMSTNIIYKSKAFRREITQNLVANEKNHLSAKSEEYDGHQNDTIHVRRNETTDKKK